MTRGNRQMKNHAAESDLFRRRALVGFLAVTVALIGLGAWYFRLQVLQHAEFATRSEANRLRLVPVVPARGLILDRKGRILADNVAAWRLDAVPERAGDGQVLQLDEGEGRILFGVLAASFDRGAEVAGDVLGEQCSN